MGEEYLVRGATLRCTMGTATSKLNLPVCHGVYCTGKPMMHMMDYIPMVNIMPFGSCIVLQGAPCVPVTIPWMIPNMTFHLTGHIPAITTKSFCVCLLGGMISPNDSGQGVIQVKLNGPVERAGAKGSKKASDEDFDDGLTYDEKSGILAKGCPIECNGGNWLGERGNSKWIPISDYIPTKYNPDNWTWEKILNYYNVDGGIEFIDAEPNFSSISKKSVCIKNFSNSRRKNFIAADEMLAKQLNCSPEEIFTWRKTNKYTWHECNDCETMQLVPSLIHTNISHYGGISIKNNDNKES